MQEHELKTWPEPFQALWERRKTHELRKDDRGYGVGDILRQREYVPGTGIYTGRLLIHEVTYLSRGPEWGLPEGLCVMSVREVVRAIFGPLDGQETKEGAS